MTEHQTKTDEESCPICAQPFKPDDLCASDIELGICHAECLDGSPVVDLDTGEPTDGEADKFRYGDTDPVRWTRWQGGEMPVPEGAAVEVILRYGKQVVAQAGSGYATRWSCDSKYGDHDDIVFYRLYSPAPETHLVGPALSPKLLPCPFCWSSASLETGVTADIGGEDIQYVTCVECSAQADPHDWQTRPEAASHGQQAMTVAEIEQWIESCNHEPACETLRHYLALRSPPSETNYSEPYGYVFGSVTFIPAGSDLLTSSVISNSVAVFDRPPAPQQNLVVTDQMVADAREAYRKQTGTEDYQLDGWIDEALRAAIVAALAPEGK